MKKIIQSISLIILTMWVQPAMAYLDPGSGSAIMSAIIGTIAAVFLAIKTYWYKLKAIFVGKKSDPIDTSEQELTEDKKEP